MEPRRGRLSFGNVEAPQPGSTRGAMDACPKLGHAPFTAAQRYNSYCAGFRLVTTNKPVCAQNAPFVPSATFS